MTTVAPLQLKSKICLVGEKAVGKTSLIRRYVLDQFDDDYIRTIGAKVSKKTMRVTLPERKASVDITMAIWDIIGHMGFRQLLADVYGGVRATGRRSANLPDSEAHRGQRANVRWCPPEDERDRQ